MDEIKHFSCRNKESVFIRNVPKNMTFAWDSELLKTVNFHKIQWVRLPFNHMMRGISALFLFWFLIFLSCTKISVLFLSYRQNLFLLSPATSIEGEGIEFAVDKVMVNTCAGPQKAHCRLLCHRYVPPHPEINCIQVSALFYLPTLLSPFSGIKNMMSSDVWP